MRWLVLVVAGCGRVGFSGDAAIDSVPADAPDPSLVIRYSLDDDPATGTIADRTGNGFDARCIPGGTCPTSVAGKVGNALHFDGTSQYASVLYRSSLDLAGAFTIALWVKTDNGTRDQVAIGRPVGTASSDSMANVRWTNQTCFETTIAGEVHQDVCGAFVIPPNEWHHVVAVCDASSKAIWIDGVRLAQTPGQPLLYDLHDLYIGSDQNAGSPAYQWEGSIDELRIYNRALSGSEIQQLML